KNMSSSDDSSSRKSSECHRFFGYGKRIPRDVKRHCGMCRQHGVVVETRGHICQFKNCECDKCKLVRKRRSIMSTQIRLRREQDKRFQ
ncbi:DM DNA binding domain protein, partial [Teladorsagia circumcincta]